METHACVESLKGKNFYNVVWLSIRVIMQLFFFFLNGRGVMQSGNKGEMEFLFYFKKNKQNKQTNNNNKNPVTEAHVTTPIN